MYNKGFSIFNKLLKLNKRMYSNQLIETRFITLFSKGLCSCWT